MLECAYHVQAKDGFQFLCVNGRFSKIRSRFVNCIFVTQAPKNLYACMYTVPAIASYVAIATFSLYS